MFENMKDINAIGCVWLRIMCKKYKIVVIVGNFINFYISFCGIQNYMF